MILEKGEGIKTTITPRLIPLLVALILIGVLWFILFVTYGIMRDVVRKTVDNMRDRNILFSRDGLRVGVRGFGSEQDYKDFAERLVSLPLYCILQLQCIYGGIPQTLPSML